MQNLLRFIAKIICSPIPNKELRRQFRHKVEGWFGCMELSAQQSYLNSVYQKVAGLRQSAAEIDTLVLGDSHAECGYLPFLDKSGKYNLAFSSNSLNESYQSLRWAQALCPNLRQVVLVLSFYNCGYLMSKGKDMWRPLILSKVLDFEFDLNEKRADFAAWKKAVAYLEPDKNFFCVQGYDFASTYQDEYPQKKVAQRVAHHFKIYQKYKNQLPVLEAICDFCAAHHLQLLLADSPVRQDYRDYLDTLNPARADLTQELKDIALNRNIPWLEAPIYEIDDFADADHLNFRGALKFTRYIDSHLAK